MENKNEEKNQKAQDEVIRAWVPFISKFVNVMIHIEDLVEAKKEMEKDPCFIHILEKFMDFKEQFDKEHPTEKEDDDDDLNFCEDEEMKDLIRKMKTGFREMGISVKVKKVIKDIPMEDADKKLFSEIPPGTGFVRIS
ncbi:MAG: hypothetical protein K5882_01660 [Bacteroidales bacterium]|nr:hypothetical protein [Bacteroidales bacterium]